jgi:hypothetical protein
MTMPTTPASACPPGVEALALLAERCGACHGARSGTKGLDLVSPGVGGRLVGAKSTCEGRLQLETANPYPTGLLLDKIDGPVPGCGPQMPYGAPLFNAAERACVGEWAARAIAQAAEGK